MKGLPGQKMSPLQKKQLCCVLAGIVLFFISQIQQASHKDMGFYLERNSVGQEVRTYQLFVSGLLEKETMVDLSLDATVYDEQSALTMMDLAYEELCQSILAGNPSLDEVRWDLQLPGSLPEYGISINWESDNPQRLNAYGQVHTKDCAEQGEQVRLTATLTAGDFQNSYLMILRVRPPILTEKEKQLRDFLLHLEQLQQQENTKQQFYLPDQWQGRPLTFRMPKEKDTVFLLIAGFVAAALLTCQEKAKQKEAKQKREAQMMLDYADLLSKLMIYIGAGFTVGKAWERIVTEYERSLAGGKGKNRYVYQEMAKTYGEMERGVSPLQAYEDFGTRCGLLPYRRLAGLLQQTIRTGTKQLRGLMALEMTAAFEQRKAVAKRLGEEAGTKMLVPLFFMLAVVMIMIVMPAMLSFQL